MNLIYYYNQDSSKNF